MSRIRELLKEAFTEENLWLAFVLVWFGGVFAYCFVKHVPCGLYPIIAGIGYACYGWGYMQGRKRQANDEATDEDDDYDDGGDGDRPGGGMWATGDTPLTTTSLPVARPVSAETNAAEGSPPATGS